MQRTRVNQTRREQGGMARIQKQTADMFTAQTARRDGIMNEPTTTQWCVRTERRGTDVDTEELYSTEEGGAVHWILHSTGLCFRCCVDDDSSVCTEVLMPCPLPVAPCDVFTSCEP